MGEASGTSQRSTDGAMAKMKKTAAKLGANGIIFRGMTTRKTQATYCGLPAGPPVGAETGLDGEAIFVGD
jgi:uncharacterized protein YbjQ (UPF0145 family)